MNIRVRKAVLTDAEGIARVHIDSWKSTYKLLIPDSYLSSLSYAERKNGWEDVIEHEKYSVYVAEISKQIVGFVSGGRQRSQNDPEYSSELGAIYLLKYYQRQAIGKRLVVSLVEKLLEQGHTSMLVWVLSDNPFRRFYEKLGGKYLQSKQIEIGGSSYTEVAYGWKDLEELLDRSR